MQHDDKEMAVKRLNNDMETVEGFCYLVNALYASGGSHRQDQELNRWDLENMKKVCMEGFHDRWKRVSKLHQVGNTVLKWNSVFKRSGTMTKNWVTYDESHVWSEADW